MKQLALLLLYGCWLHGQSSPTPVTDKSMLVTGTFAVSAGATTEVHSVVIRGASVRTGKSLLSCRGGCEMKLGSVVLEADEVDFHTDTGEGAVEGKVRVRQLPRYERTTRQDRRSDQ